MLDQHFDAYIIFTNVEIYLLFLISNLKVLHATIDKQSKAVLTFYFIKTLVHVQNRFYYHCAHAILSY